MKEKIHIELQKTGLSEEEKKKLLEEEKNVDWCMRCNTLNEVDNKVCINCGYPLDCPNC